jgi:hypothetical protein
MTPPLLMMISATWLGSVPLYCHPYCKYQKNLGKRILMIPKMIKRKATVLKRFICFHPFSNSSRSPYTTQKCREEGILYLRTLKILSKRTVSGNLRKMQFL